MGDPAPQILWREALSRRLAVTMAGVSAALVVPLAFGVADAASRWFFVALTATTGVLLAATLHRRAPWRIRAWTITGTFAIVGIAGIARVGFLAGPALALTMAFVVSGILLGFRALAVLSLVLVLASSGLGIAMTEGWIPPPPPDDVSMLLPRVWLRTGATAALMIVTLGVVVVGVVRSLEGSLEDLRRESTQRLAAEAARPSAPSSRRRRWRRSGGSLPAPPTISTTT